MKKSFVESLETIKALSGVTQADFDLLKEIESEASQWVGELTQFFYDTVFAHERTAAVFHDGERPMREEALQGWLMALFTTANDENEYWFEQGRIAFAHIRRHVSNEFMIGIAVKMNEFFIKKAVETFGVERGMEIARAFNRILQTVIGLTAEGYDVMFSIVFSEVTGADIGLIDSLIQSQIDEVQAAFSE